MATKDRCRVTVEGVNEGKKSSNERCAETTKPQLSNNLFATREEYLDTIR